MIHSNYTLYVLSHLKGGVGYHIDDEFGGACRRRTSKVFEATSFQTF